MGSPQQRRGDLGGVNELTMKTVEKSEVTIMASVAGGTPKRTKIFHKPYDHNIQRAEKALNE
jgi:hypothetical protein